ncbi:MAG: CHAD domain-containing protein [Vicinamibacterales bacterium]
MNSEAQFFARDQASADALARSLELLLSTRSRLPRRQRLVFLDTVDGRIAAAGGRLATHADARGTHLEWRPRDRQVRLEHRVTAPVAFAWDLPQGPLRDRLAPVIATRRLLPQVELDLQARALDVLDNEQKTVARILIETGRARQPRRTSPWCSFPTLVTLTAIRGYDAAYQHVLPIVESRPGLERCLAGLQSVALDAVGAPPPRDLSRFDVTLAPEVSADAGARQIYRALLDIMVANEPGVRADLDTDFLHDFRVAVRRTRSLLGQLKGALAADAVAHFKTEFRSLARATGPTRDLDVLLLSLHKPIAGMPAKHVATLRGLVCTRRRREHRRLLRVLESDRYQVLLADWHKFLEIPSPEAARPAQATQPLIVLASRRIWRLYRRLVDEASAIHADTPAAALHEIRIDAKKLRYVIDAARTLYDRRHLERVIGSLKRTQRVLGEFNDAQVQARYLLDSGRVLAQGRAKDPSVLLTVGRLAEQVSSRGAALRDDVARELVRFCEDDLAADFRRLFKDVHGEAGS